MFRGYHSTTTISPYHRKLVSYHKARRGGKRYARKLTGMSNGVTSGDASVRHLDLSAEHNWSVVTPPLTGQPEYQALAGGGGGGGAGRRMRDNAFLTQTFPRHLPFGVFCLTPVLVPNEFCLKRRWTPAGYSSSPPPTPPAFFVCSLYVTWHPGRLNLEPRRGKLARCCHRSRNHLTW